MKIKPLGFYVLIEMVKIENVSEGGIILQDDTVNKEQDATDTGYVRDIGPTAYEGYPGCDKTERACEPRPDTEFGWTDPITGLASPDEIPIPPHECWGLKIGQKIEYRKFEGKKSSVLGYENYRYIPDSHIIGAIDDE